MPVLNKRQFKTASDVLNKLEWNTVDFHSVTDDGQVTIIVATDVMQVAVDINSMGIGVARMIEAPTSDDESEAENALDEPEDDEEVM